MKLLNAPGQSHEQVFGEELRKYEPLQAKLRDNHIKQDTLLSELSVEHKKFIQVGHIIDIFFYSFDFNLLFFR